ncbi:MAG: Gx transporter family protein, partial [Lachnospiraceae bacterium]|nr:Gx transporter family protein [Lachnospiraceae bacterium]
RYNTVEKNVRTQSTFLPALAISVVRVLLAGITYNGLSASLYGLTGAVASLLVMHLLKRAGLFSITAISVAGGVTHNAAQLALACLILGSAVFYYLPWLIISGLVSGAAIGLLSALLVRKLKKQSPD